MHHGHYKDGRLPINDFVAEQSRLAIGRGLPSLPTPQCSGGLPSATGDGLDLERPGFRRDCDRREMTTLERNASDPSRLGEHAAQRDQVAFNGRVVRLPDERIVRLEEHQRVYRFAIAERIVHLQNE